MVTDMNNTKAFHTSAKGSSHIKNNTVCQDASWSDCNDKRSIVIVADGHGNKRYCRSDKGSQFAVNCAAEVIDEFLENTSEQDWHEIKYNDTLTKLCNCIIARWHTAIEKSVEENPFTEEELKDIPQKYAQDYLDGINIAKAYGTTLIAVFTVGERCFGIHIGDGKCVALYEDGSINEPIPWDEDCIFNITTSLCDESASEKFRYAEIINPVAVFIGTDGIDDTYGTGLHYFYLNVVNMMQTQGYESTVKYLDGYMSTISENGSHDDVSLAAVINNEKLGCIKETVNLELKRHSLEIELQKEESKINDLDFAVNKSGRMYLELKSKGADIPELSEKISSAQEQYLQYYSELKECRHKVSQLKFKLEHIEECEDIIKSSDDESAERAVTTESKQPAENPDAAKAEEPVESSEVTETEEPMENPEEIKAAQTDILWQDADDLNYEKDDIQRINTDENTSIHINEEWEESENGSTGVDGEMPAQQESTWDQS